MKPVILIIDDEESMLTTFKSVLKNDYELVLLSNGADTLPALRDNNIALILLDVMMPGQNGLDVLRTIKDFDKNLAVIMVTAAHDIKLAVKAIKLGAEDYVTKPFEAESLLATIAQALAKRSLVRENIYLKQVLAEKGYQWDLIGRSAPAKKTFELIAKAAKVNSTVLITGESGTGKELVAHAIHKSSARAAQPFVVVNCASLPESLIEAELFGHEKGAFTGALERKEGKFELADNGTIFLDEIGCMPLNLQSRLLRVLQDNSVEKLGGTKPIKVDVRVIAATNLALEEAIKKNEFRSDLFYRLNVIRVQLAPLRERKEDIPLYAEYFVEKYSREFNKGLKGLSQEAIRLLINYDWPGNVRELQNLMERIVALTENTESVQADDIPLEAAAKNVVQEGLKEALLDFERRYIKNALAEAAGNQTKAAELLNIHRTTLISKMDQLGLK
ncbi:MAG: sigma-54 dependent transcriptional regulator [Candidatus Margulisiibacteriota bacterium]